MAEVDLFQDEQDDFYAPGDEETLVPDSPNEDKSVLTPEQLVQYRQHDEWATRFAQDEAFARNVIVARAAQLGLQITAPPSPASVSGKPAGPPAEYVETIKATLAPEMQFLAPQLAVATWTATQAAIEPIKTQQASLAAQRQQETYETMARGLAEEAPGWERYEDTMLDILTFLRGAVNNTGSMTHPKYGSALKLLYQLASGEGAAVATAARRQQQAARNRTSTSQAGTRSAGPDLATMLSQAKTPQQKWAMAYRHALRENGVTG